MENLDYRALAVLDAVVRHGSFEKAALALGITQSAVSQRVKVLEDSSGRLLIVRGQPASPTGLGQRLIVHYRHVKLMESALDIDLGNHVSMPEMAIAMDADSLATWFPATMLPLLTPPRCQLDIRTADSEQAMQLVREGSVFGCIAAGTDALADEVAGTTVTALGLMRYVCVATPMFAGHWFGDGFSAEAVQLAPAAVSDRRLLERFLHQQFALVAHFPHHTIPASTALNEAIEGGMAYGLMPLLQVQGALASQRLLDLTPGRCLDLPLQWHAWTLDTPFTKLLSEQIVGSARRVLLQ